MRKNHACILIIAVGLTLQGVAGAQSLADVARAEEARRKSVKAPSKTYTNDDLKGGTDSSSVASPSAASTAPASTQAAKPADGAPKADAAKDVPAQADPKKDEKYWRDRFTATQRALARDKVLLDALQSRVNALNADFVNIDDPAQRAVVQGNLQSAMAEMERVKTDIDVKTKETSTIQEEARKANVPSGWLR